MCDEVAKLFVDTFNNDFKKGIPFLPTKKVIMNTIPVPLIDPASLAIIQSFIFKITSVHQPPIYPSLRVTSTTIHIRNYGSRRC